MSVGLTRRTLIGLAAGAAVLALPAFSAAQAGAMAGMVVAGDRVVPGAQVRVFSVYHVLVRRGETNAEGHFGFRQFRPGPYIVFAAKREVGVGRAPVRIVSGEVARVRVELHQPGGN